MDILKGINTGIPILMSMPVWMRWWFFIAIVIGTLFGLVFAVWYIARAFNINELIEQRTVERTKVAVERTVDDFNLEIKLIEDRFNDDKRKLQESLGQRRAFNGGAELKEKTDLTLHYKVELVKLRKAFTGKVEDIIYNSYGKRDINLIKDLENEARICKLNFGDKTTELIKTIEELALKSAEKNNAKDYVKNRLNIE